LALLEILFIENIIYDAKLVVKNCIPVRKFYILILATFCFSCKKEVQPVHDVLLTAPNQFKKYYIAKFSPTNLRNSEGDIIALKSGRFLAAYTRFGSKTNDAAPSQIAGRISADDAGDIWGDEFIISQNIGLKNVISVSLFQDDQTLIHCYFLVNNGVKDVRYYQSASSDDGATWSDAKPVINQGDYLDVVNAAVHTVNHDRIIIPATSTQDASDMSAIFSSFTYYSDDGGKTFAKSNVIKPATKVGGFEPSVVQLAGDNLMMAIRPPEAGFQYFSKSTDNGTTWQQPFQSTLSSSSSPAKIVNVNGILLAIHNPNININPRNPLRISKSEDGGATWTMIADMESSDTNTYNYAYPSITIKNGYLLVSYWETVGTSGINLKFSKIKISQLGII